MRAAAARWAAGLLVLALASGCKPSSLSPFTGDKGLQGGESVNGIWIGNATGGGGLRFSVGSERVGDLRLEHRDRGCIRYFVGGDSIPVEGNTFLIEEEYSDGGRLVVEGVFTSNTTGTGTYSFEQVSIIGACPRSGTATFVVNKVG